MLQVVICDDEQIALKKVKRELIRYRESRKVHFKILEYDNPELLYYDVTDGNLSEVYILDVDMPKKNGLTLVETVHEKNPNAEVLILSAFPEYGVDAVNIGGIRRYVTKDLLGKKLFSALDDVFRMVKKNQEELYSRYWHNEKRLVEKDRILYIQKVGKYCDFTVEGEEELRERMSITDVFDKLALHRPGHHCQYSPYHEYRRRPRPDERREPAAHQQVKAEGCACGHSRVLG